MAELQDVHTVEGVKDDVVVAHEPSTIHAVAAEPSFLLYSEDTAGGRVVSFTRTRRLEAGDGSRGVLLSAAYPCMRVDQCVLAHLVKLSSYTSFLPRLWSTLILRPSRRSLE